MMSSRADFSNGHTGPGGPHQPGGTHAHLLLFNLCVLRFLIIYVFERFDINIEKLARSYNLS